MDNIFKTLKEVSKSAGFDFETWELENLIQYEIEVTDELSIRVEPSTQAGNGIVDIYQVVPDDEGEEVLVLNNYDYGSYLERIKEIAFESDNVDEFVKGYRNYMEGLI